MESTGCSKTCALTTKKRVETLIFFSLLDGTTTNLGKIFLVQIEWLVHHYPKRVQTIGWRARQMIWHARQCSKREQIGWRARRMVWRARQFQVRRSRLCLQIQVGINMDSTEINFIGAVRFLGIQSCGRTT